MPVNGKFCCKAEAGREPGNGKLPPETFRLVGPNITKHLTAGIRSEAEVQKNPLNFRNVLEVAVRSMLRVGNYSLQKFSVW